MSDHTADDAPIPVGDRREIFVDHFLIDRLAGADLRLAAPLDHDVAFRFDQPWEGRTSGYITILPDGDGFRMYYRGCGVKTPGDARPESKEVLCVAESPDGVTWRRPSLTLYPDYNDGANNVVLGQPEPAAATHNFCPFIDDRPGCPPDERYKGVGGTAHSGLLAYASADGLRWRRLREEPILTGGAFDSQNNVFWSEHEQTYVCYYRTFVDGVRWIARAQSKEFLTDWPAGENMDFSGAPPEHLYVNQTRPYFRAPHIYLGFAARFMPGRQGLTPEQMEKSGMLGDETYVRLDEACSDAVLLSTRGGLVYRRTFLEALVRPGLDHRNWGARSNYPACGAIQTGPKEMSIFIQRHYGWPSVHVERLAWRLDGFSSVHAPYGGGEMMTRPLVFDGSELEINFASSASGGLRVEIQDAAGKPIPGFALEDCPELVGDDLERLVRWEGAGDLAALAGRTVRLRFALKDADLYALRFR